MAFKCIMSLSARKSETPLPTPFPSKVLSLKSQVSSPKSQVSSLTSQIISHKSYVSRLIFSYFCLP